MTIDRLPDRVTTPRLVLRRWQHADADVLQQIVMANLDHLRPWMPWIKQEPLTIIERARLIEDWTREWEDGGDSFLGVFLDGEPIGSSGCHARVGPGAIEIGYWIDQDHLRSGYATEVTAALTSAAFDNERIGRVQVHTDEANDASAGVPAKLGFRRARVETREPAAPGESGRLIIWTVTRETWTPPAPPRPSEVDQVQGSPNESR